MSDSMGKAVWDAAKAGKEAELGRLIGLGGNVNWHNPDYFGSTALIEASYFGHEGCVRLLLEAEAIEVNATNIYDETALHYAAFNGRLATAKRLLEGGADPTLRNKYGKTAVDLAREQGKSEVVALLSEPRWDKTGAAKAAVDKAAADKAAAAQQSELEAAAKRNEIQREQRRLEQEWTKVRELEAAAEAKARAAAQLTSDAKAEAAQQQAQAQARRKELEAEEKRVALECARRKAEAESAEAKATKERDELRIERKKARAMPDYWETRIATSSPDGFAAIALDPGRDRSTWAALERLLQTDPVKLKQSGADRSGTTHDRLKLACAWRLENPALWEKYMSGVQGVMNDMERIRQGRVASAKRIRQCRVASKGALPGDLRVDVNEAFLMHGTNAGVLFNILSQGMNERFAGTAAGAAYGEGSYLAEDAGKNDQYTKVDPQYDGSSELHKRLYAHGARHHPAKVFYILVCRVALGHQVRTQQMITKKMRENREKGLSPASPTSTDTGRPVFPIVYRELDTVAGVSPPVLHHSLLADVMDVGARYREFIVFHSEYIYPEYLLAYQRYEGGRGPMA